MTIEQAIARFRELHARHKDGLLAAGDRAQYEALRDDFLQTLARAQRLSLRPGQSPRQTIRVASAMRLEVTTPYRRESTVTLDLGVSGFAALVQSSAPVGTICDFVLHLPREPLRGAARVVGSVRHGSGVTTNRVSFALRPLPDRDRERLENAVIDAALAAFAG